MRRTTIMLPNELKAEADATARARGISFGELVRESLTRALERTRSGRAVAGDPFWDDHVVYAADAPADLAVDHDRYLYGDRGAGDPELR